MSSFGKLMLAAMCEGESVADAGMAAHGGPQLINQRAHGIVGKRTDPVKPRLQFRLGQIIGQTGTVQRIDRALDDFLKPAEIGDALPQSRREITGQGVMRFRQGTYSRHSVRTQSTGRR